MNLGRLQIKLRTVVKKICPPQVAKDIIKNLKVNISNDLKLGDYSSNLIFLLKKYSPNLERDVLKAIQAKLKNYFSKIEVTNNFLNFTLADKILAYDFKNLFRRQERFWFSNIGRGRKVILEFISANPTGPLTLGNGRSAAFGEVLSKVLTINNYKVVKEFYVNDRGKQIEILGQTIKALVFNLPKEEYFYQGEYLNSIANELRNKINLEMSNEKIGKIAADYILERFIKPSLDKFGIFFDNFFYESSLYKSDLKKKILKIYERQKLLEVRDGALWLLLTKVGESKDEVLITKDGRETYFFSDILYHYNKFYERKFKLGINILGADHLDHARRLKRALTLLKIKESKVKFIVYQMVNVKKEARIVRMSKRKGIFVTLDELIEIVDKSIVKFFFLRQTMDRHLVLDLDLMSKQSEENPAWYIRYAYVRFNGIYQKSMKKFEFSQKKIDLLKSAFQLIENENYKNILRELHLFKDLLEVVARNFEVNLLAERLVRLAKTLHNFYEKEPILKDSKLLEKKSRMVYIIKQSLSFLMDLLGIETLEKM